MSNQVDAKWPEVRLGDHARVKARLGWKGLKAEEYVLDGPIFLAAPNLRSGRIDFDQVDHLPQWRYEESPEIQLAVGDVLLVKDGSTLGMSGIVKALPAPTTVNGSIAVIRPGASLASGFLFYSINAQRFQRLIWLRRAGLGVPHLFQADLREFEIALPTVVEQNRIAAILSALDETVEQTEALIAKHYQIKSGLTQDLFTRGVTPDGLRVSRAQAPQIYKESPLGWIPKEWKFTTLSDCLLGPPKNGYSPRETNEWSGIYALGLACLTPEGFRPTQLKMVSGGGVISEAALLIDGDLLLSRSNTRALVGLCGVYRDIGAPCIYPDLMIRLRLNGRVSTQFLEALLLSPVMRRTITAAAVGTSGSMVKLNSRSVRGFKFALPDENEQSLILRVVNQFQAAIRSLKEDLDKLRKLKQGLMDDLLSGRVPIFVKQSEKDPG